MIRALHQKLKNRETTATALADEYLKTIEHKDGEIGAYLSVLTETALAQAASVDERFTRGEDPGLLAGIPAAIKDNMCLSGTRTTAGSKILEHYVAPYTATAVSRLEKAGAVILGKTNMDEFAMGSSTESSAFQKTRNPLAPDRVPGGSSGGSAAAVAGEMAVYSLGSDTGGSIRQPASFCGLVGLKPTYGRVSRHGLLAMASSLDQIGPFAHTVEDAAIVLSAIAGHDPLDATSAESGGKRYEDFLTRDIAGLRIAVIEEHFSESLAQPVREAAEAAIAKFEKLGAEIVRIRMPEVSYGLPVYYLIMPAEVSSNLARFDGIKYGLSLSPEAGERETAALLAGYLKTREAGFGPEVKRRIMLGTYALSAGYYDAYYKKAMEVRALMRRAFERVFAEADLIFSPTSPEAAFAFGAKNDDPVTMYLSDVYTVTANLVGVPAVSFPIGDTTWDGATLPLGGQLMGRWFDEETLLRAADAYERA